MVLRPPQVHPAQHLRPVGGVGPARARADRDDRAVRVVRAIEICRHLELVERFVGAHDRRVGLGFGAFFVAQDLDDLRRVAERGVDRIDRIEVGAQVRDALHHAASLLGIAPEIVSARARFELGYGTAFARVVKAAP